MNPFTRILSELALFCNKFCGELFWAGRKKKRRKRRAHAENECILDSKDQILFKLTIITRFVHTTHNLRVWAWARLRVAYHGVDARFRPTETIQDQAEVVPRPEEEDIIVNRPTHHFAGIEQHALRRHRLPGTSSRRAHSGCESSPKLVYSQRRATVSSVVCCSWLRTEPPLQTECLSSAVSTGLLYAASYPNQLVKQ